MAIEFNNKIQEMSVFCDVPECDSEAITNGDWRDSITNLKYDGWVFVELDGNITTECPKHKLDFS